MNLKQMIENLKAQLTEYKVIKVLVGKHKKPIDKKDEIIFHIDI
tara:strand:- start:93 stop:224 length:132 start_codon:yes stop_codon:yes gene_type:complete